VHELGRDGAQRSNLGFLSSTRAIAGKSRRMRPRFLFCTWSFFIW
jgi:hypothetical protein